MKHIVALLIKTAMVLFVFSVILTLLFDYPFGPTIVLTLLVVGISYLVGDMWILPKTNNTVATLADIGLCTVKVWLIGSFVYGEPVPFTVALLASIVLGVGEWLFHNYVSKGVIGKTAVE